MKTAKSTMVEQVQVYPTVELLFAICTLTVHDDDPGTPPQRSVIESRFVQSMGAKALARKLSALAS
jgi:hypothetical protein